MPEQTVSTITETTQEVSSAMTDESDMAETSEQTVTEESGTDSDAITESEVTEEESASETTVTEVSEDKVSEIILVDGSEVIVYHNQKQTETFLTFESVPETGTEDISESDISENANTETQITEITFIEETTTVQETQTEVTTEVTEPVVYQPEGIVLTNEMLIYGGIGLVALIFLIVCIVIGIQKKKVQKQDDEDEEEVFEETTEKEKKKSAKQRDTERINQKKREENEKKAKEKKNKAGKTKKIRKTVKDTLPYQKCLEYDIWRIADRTYSKVYTIDDINYNLGDETQQEYVVNSYCQFLNTLDETIVCQVTVRNYEIDVAEYEKDILIKLRGDEFDDYRREYNEKVLKPNLSKGSNAIRKQILITITIECPDFEAARRKFSSIDLTIKNSFDHIGNTRLRPLTNKERCDILKEFFISSEYKMPDFTDEEYAKDVEKTYLAPDYFEFKKDYFLFGDYYAKCVFIKEYPNNTSDNVINDLMQTNLQMIVTSTMLAYDTAKAKKLIQRQIGAITGDMGAREAKAAKSGFFSQQMPVKIRNMLDSYKELFDMISLDDEKLFVTNTIIMVRANSYEELNQSMEVVSSALKRNGFSYSEMMWQQEDGMCDCLPVGSCRRFQWNRTLPTESVGIFVPFNVKEVRQKNVAYYGCNKLSNNIVTFGRNMYNNLINPAGYILGAPGGGKSFSAKREMEDTFLRYEDAEIIVIDPEREYPAMTNMFKGQSIKVSTSSKNYINPFDFDFRLLEDDGSGDDEDSYDVIKEKSQLITSFIACMYTNRPLTPQELSFIDRCVRITYRNSQVLLTLDPNDMPILEDLYNVMATETENVDPDMKRDMLATLEMYVGEGSANYFNHRTNMDIYNRFVSFDIKDLTGVLKTQAMLLVLDNIWNRLSANRERHIPTWIYCDEIHVLFANEYCLKFFQGLYKRARKYGGVLTGITQNISDLLRNEECCTMLSNSEFLLLLKQAPADMQRIQEVMGLSDSELFYVTNVSAGEGLMVLGSGDKIPFYDKFPKDTKLYKAMTTNFSETQSVMDAG